MERPNQRLTDADRISQDIDNWLSEGAPHIGDTTARIIASRWHDGQGSALYSFQSSGAIDIQALRAEIVASTRGDMTPDDFNELTALLHYIECAQFDRQPVDGWHDRTRWDVGE